MEPRKSISGRSIMDSHFEDTEGSFMKSSDSHEWNKSFDFFATVTKFVGKITEEDYKSLENCLRQRETKRNRVTQISPKVEDEDKNRECECDVMVLVSIKPKKTHMMKKKRKNNNNKEFGRI